MLVYHNHHYGLKGLWLFSPLTYLSGSGLFFVGAPLVGKTWNIIIIISDSVSVVIIIIIIIIINPSNKLVRTVTVLPLQSSSSSSSSSSFQDGKAHLSLLSVAGVAIAFL